MTSTHRRIVATSHGGPHEKVRRSLEAALDSLRLDPSQHARQAMAEAGLGDRVVEYGRELDKLLDGLATHAVAQSRTLIAERDRIHSAANAHARDDLATRPRVDGLVRGPVVA